MSTGTGDVLAQVQQIVDFFEGGLSDQPCDRGGLTKYGVTFEAYRRVRPCATPEDVKALTKEDAVEFLAEEYVLKPGISRIVNDAVRFAVIDYAINSGSVTAVRALQKAAGVTADGVFGRDTEDAVNRFEAVSLLRLVVSARLRHLGRLITKDPRQAAFAAGWLNRVATILEAA